jgi:hypothetical protein
MEVVKDELDDLLSVLGDALVNEGPEGVGFDGGLGKREGEGD